MNKDDKLDLSRRNAHQYLNINFLEILNIALAGIRRSSIFLGLGLNAAWNPEYKNYLLLDSTKIHFIPQQLSDSDIENAKRDFANWLVGNGLREVNEHFDVFLDKIYEATMMGLVFKHEKIDHEKYAEIKNKCKRFSKKGIEDKFEELKKSFEFTSDNKDCHLSLKKARNCLSHRLGRVEDIDCNDEDKLTISWLTLDIVTIKNGEKGEIIELPIKQQHILTGNVGLGYSYSKTCASFAKGMIVNLNPKNINEICFFYAIEAEKIKDSAVEFLKQKGIIFDN